MKQLLLCFLIVFFLGSVDISAANTQKEDMKYRQISPKELAEILTQGKISEQGRGHNRKDDVTTAQKRGSAEAAARANAQEKLGEYLRGVVIAGGTKLAKQEIRNQIYTIDLNPTIIKYARQVGETAFEYFKDGSLEAVVEIEMPLAPIMRQEAGLHAGLRSAVIPGWGQLYKGQRSKGLIILGGETFFISGGFLAKRWSHDYYSKAKNARYQEDRDFYLRWSNILSDISLAAWVIAGLTHVYNLIDAFESKEGFPKREAEQTGRFGFQINNRGFMASYFKPF
ncbi:TPA: hypothetical protein EYP66_23830 [Candidatus Poribacteria bacterium]|nr:hypothetical protein [Candidatus Poribacteria bacterium]